MNKIGIYIHVPFCAKKCPYCDFYSEGYSKDRAEGYTRGIIRDINAFEDNATADTIYFGGGTPSLLPADNIESIISALKRRFKLISPEITLEVNPSTVTKKKLEAYLEMGINRLSFGVQSAWDDELTLLGRLHTFETAGGAVKLARDTGFENISCDLMLGIPHQTEKSLMGSIHSICSLPVTHISSYMLKIEKGTPFDNDNIKKQLPQEDAVSDLYLRMIDKLKEYGFKQYEISNFSLPGYESRHNLKYWECSEYLGFGTAAHSYYRGKRYYYPSDIMGFIEKSPDPVLTDEAPGQWDEQIMLGLRLKKGIDTMQYPHIKDRLMKKAIVLEKAGYMEITGSRIALTPKGFLLSNSIIAELTDI